MGRRLAMRNNILQIVKLLPRIAVVVIVVFSFAANFISLKYIEKLENQVYKRDSIISELAFSNSLVKEYFDMIDDSVNNRKMYVLKDNKKTKVEVTKYLKPTFFYDAESLTPDEFVKEVNKKDSMYQQLLTSLYTQNQTLYTKYNSLAEKYNRTILEMKELNDTIISQRTALNLIKRNYDIGYSWNIRENSIEVKLESSKADSAYILLSNCRDKLNYDEKKGVWTIKR